MRTHLEKLLALLAHKRAILEELVERQEKLKAFLVRPHWHKFNEYTRPQEELLQKLRQIQAAQDFLLSELAASFRVATLPNLRTLCHFIDSEWKSAIMDAAEHIRVATGKLRKLTRLSQALNQAHWNYLKRYMADGHGRTDLGTTYNANGYASAAALINNRYNAAV